MNEQEKADYEEAMKAHRSVIVSTNETAVFFRKVGRGVLGLVIWFVVTLIGLKACQRDVDMNPYDTEHPDPTWMIER